jgi:hypothetical protein
MVADVAESVGQGWPTEGLPPDAWFFRRAHSTFHTKGRPNRGAFKGPDSELTVYWAKYATAKETRHGDPQRAAEYAVLALRLSDLPLRELGLTITHTPNGAGTGNVKLDRAHCDIAGNLTPEARDRLLEKSHLIIPIEEPVDYDPPNPT